MVARFGGATARRSWRLERTSAEDPVMIIYTSGTTGKPKGAVHTHCGFPIKAAQDLSHGFDLKPGDALYWMTDMGWMMGPWEVWGALLLGANVLFYDGAPDYPGVDRLVGAGRAPRRDRPGRLAHADPQPASLRRRACQATRSFVPALVRLHRLALGPGVVVVAVRGGWRQAGADPQLLREEPKSRAASSRETC